MISSHKKQRAGSIFCVLLLLISLSLSGCQKKGDGKWLYADEQLSAIEALYGYKLPEVLAEFQLKESDVSESTTMLGAWDMPESVSIVGK